MAKPGIGEKLLLLVAAGYIIFQLFSLKLALFIVFAVIAGQTAYVKWKLSLWKRLHVPGPPPTLYFGNILNFSDGTLHQKQIEWSRKYGRIIGSYFSTKPDLSISDIELLRHVLVKDFHNFTNRMNFVDPDDRVRMKTKPRSVFDNMLTILIDDDWRRVRNTLTPTFTSGKLKLMVPLISDCVDKFVHVLEEKTIVGKPLKMKDEFRLFTMDVIASVAFGTDVDTYNNPNNPVIFYSNQISDIFNLKSIKLWIAIMFPVIIGKLDDWFGIQILFADGDKFFQKYLRDVIEQRKRAEKPRTDFLQLLINAEANSPNEAESHAKVENGCPARAAAEGSAAGKLSIGEIISQAILFLNAGHETTSTTLSFITWSLAIYPEIQQRCFDEVREVLGGHQDKEADRGLYDLVMNKLPYMDMVIQETLRMFPPAVRIDRECENNYDLMGVFIPKNCQVSVPIYAIHHDPEYYPDPEKFIPERFSPEEKEARDPLIYLPFGYGNRNCIGMRFALLELKMAVAKLLLNFEFVPCDSTERPPVELKADGAQLLKPKKPFELLVKKRASMSVYN